MGGIGWDLVPQPDRETTSLLIQSVLPLERRLLLVLMVGVDHGGISDVTCCTVLIEWKEKYHMWLDSVSIDFAVVTAGEWRITGMATTSNTGTFRFHPSTLLVISSLSKHHPVCLMVSCKPEADISSLLTVCSQLLCGASATLCDVRSLHSSSSAVYPRLSLVFFPLDDHLMAVVMMLSIY